MRPAKALERPPCRSLFMTERISQLPNGLTVATDFVPAARSVAMGVWVSVGSRDEPAELSGVSHFLEHLLFKGTEARTATDISPRRRSCRRRHQRLHVEGTRPAAGCRATVRRVSNCSAMC